MDIRRAIAASVSPEAAAILQVIGDAVANLPPREPPATLEDFDAAAARGAVFAEYLTAGPLAALAPRLEHWTAGGIPVLTVTPTQKGSAQAADRAPLVYIHGGGFVGGSARANLLTAALAAAAGGRVVHSIDYTLAPRANWRAIQDQVIEAWNAIIERSPHTPGLFGDSAGGCIAASATLALREQGLTVPAALILLSPVVDLARGGDTNTTLAPYDYLDARTLDPGLRAYATPDEWDQPLVSPIQADFSLGYPPTLLQVGTRETLLSDSVRLHRKLRAAGQASRLEVYEGMPHVFQPILAETPEGRAAWREMADFWAEHLA